MENETIVTSGCPGPDAAKPLSRGQQVAQCMMGVGGVSDDVMDSAETTSVLDFLDGWRRSPGDLLFSNFLSEALKLSNQMQTQLLSTL